MVEDKQTSPLSIFIAIISTGSLLFILFAGISLLVEQSSRKGLEEPPGGWDPSTGLLFGFSLCSAIPLAIVCIDIANVLISRIKREPEKYTYPAGPLMYSFFTSILTILAGLIFLFISL